MLGFHSDPGPHFRWSGHGPKNMELLLGHSTGLPLKAQGPGRQDLSHRFGKEHQAPGLDQLQPIFSGIPPRRKGGEKETNLFAAMRAKSLVASFLRLSSERSLMLHVLLIVPFLASY